MMRTLDDDWPLKNSCRFSFGEDRGDDKDDVTSTENRINSRATKTMSTAEIFFTIISGNWFKDINSVG